MAVGIGVPVVAATASILAFLGVKYWGKKDNDGDPNKKPNINNPDVNNPNKNQQTENKSNDGENNPEKDPIKVLKVDINQARVDSEIEGKETIQVQNPINANPISVPIPVVQKVEPEEKSIIEKNIAKIKLGSDKKIADKTFKLFFDKVKIILDNKDKLFDNMVKVSKFDIKKNKFCKILLSEEENYDPEEYAGVLNNKEVQGVIKQVVQSTIDSLYSKEVDAYSHLSVYNDSLDLSLGGNKLILISKDGKKLYLSNYYYSIQFDASNLGIGELEY